MLLVFSWFYVFLVFLLPNVNWKCFHFPTYNSGIWKKQTVQLNGPRYFRNMQKNNYLFFFFFNIQNLHIHEPMEWRREGILLGKCSQLYYTTVRTACSVKKEGPWNYSIYFFKFRNVVKHFIQTVDPLRTFPLPECLGSSQVITTICSSVRTCIDLPHSLFLQVGWGKDGRSFYPWLGSSLRLGFF